MKKEPFKLSLPLTNIDTSTFPDDAKEIGSKDFNKALHSYFQNKYKSLGGVTDVTIVDDVVNIHWHSLEVEQLPLEHAIELLQNGHIDKALPLLEAFLQTTPDDVDVLFNLGMVYSDQGKLEQAIELLAKVVEINGKHTHGLVALGVAQYRNHNLEEAKKALQKAISIDDSDPYALRSLASIYMVEEDFIAGANILRNVSKLLPDDSITLLNLGECLVKIGNEKSVNEADSLFSQVIELTVTGDITERAKDNKRKIAHSLFRKESDNGEVRKDAVFYCFDAMNIFKELPQEKISEISLEVAQLGGHGLNVNDPKSTYHLKSLEGTFSGLALVCLLHVAVRRMSPTMDSGFDIDSEYDIAKQKFDSQ